MTDAKTEHERLMGLVISFGDIMAELESRAPGSMEYVEEQRAKGRGIEASLSAAILQLCELALPARDPDNGLMDSSGSGNHLIARDPGDTYATHGGDRAWAEPDCAPITEFNAAEATAKLAAAESERRRGFVGPLEQAVRNADTALKSIACRPAPGPGDSQWDDEPLQLAVGDQVQLKSGGPVMEVRETIDAAAYCEWDHGLGGRYFHPGMLRRVEP